MDHRIVDTIYNPGVYGGGTTGEEYFSKDRSTFFAYGRTALSEGLVFCGLKRGDTLLLPALICNDIISRILKLGIDIEFYGVGKNLECRYDSIERLAKKGVKALLFVNYFGFPQPVKPLKSLAEKYQFALIEDNAHGFLSRVGNMLLGFRTDIGIFSIRKTIGVPNGAVLVINNDIPVESEKIKTGKKEGEHSYCGIKEITSIVKEWIRPVISCLPGSARMRILRLLWSLKKGIIRNRNNKEEIPLGGEVIKDEKVSFLFHRFIKRLDEKKEKARRRTLFTACGQEIKKWRDCFPVFENLPDGVTPYGYPFFYYGSGEEQIQNLLSKDGLYCVQWPDLPEIVKKDAKEYYLKLFFIPFLW